MLDEMYRAQRGGFGLGAVPSWAAVNGIPATADWDNRTTSIATATSFYGKQYLFPGGATADSLLGIMWDPATWKLVPYSAVPLPKYPDKIVQGVPGTPFVSGAQSGAPVYGISGPSVPTTPAQPGYQWVWDNASQSYKQMPLAKTAEQLTFEAADANATAALAAMDAAITAFQQSAKQAIAMALQDLSIGGNTNSYIAAAIGPVNDVITKGAAALTDLRNQIAAKFQADKTAQSVSYSQDVTAGQAQFNQSLAQWQEQQDKVARAAIYGQVGKSSAVDSTPVSHTIQEVIQQQLPTSSSDTMPPGTKTDQPVEAGLGGGTLAILAAAGLAFAFFVRKR